MFGFGRPSNEKAVINQFALQLESIGLSTKEALQAATKLVDEVLFELRPRGVDPFKNTQGNEYAARDSFTAPRLAAGLTIEDIKSHWNRPILIVLCEMKMRELINFIVVDSARQQGKDPSAAALQYKKSFPRYGDPSRWDPTEKFNAGLKEMDADVYPEFAGRIDAWRRARASEAVDQLIREHGTLNAAIRHQVSIGEL